MCCIKVKVIRVRVKVNLACQSSTSVFGYNSCSIGLIETILGVWVDVDEGFKLEQGQGHWVKGQSQIRNLVKILF